MTTTMPQWFTAQQLAGLPGMPQTYSAVIRAMKKNLAVTRSKLREKGKEYALSSLPAETQAYFTAQAQAAAFQIERLEEKKQQSLMQVAKVKVDGVCAKFGQVRKAKLANDMTDKDRTYQDAALLLMLAVDEAKMATDNLAKQAFEGWAIKGTSAAEAIGTSLKKALVYPTLGTDKGIFRTQSFPLKPSNFQMYGGTGLHAIGSSTGTLEGGFTGTIDYKYGIIKWQSTTLINATSIRYNAVALLSLPLNPALLGLDTARLPADGKVPIYRKGDLLLVHNSQQFALQAPVQKGVVYSLGRGNLASVRISDAGGVVLPESLYTIDLANGELTFTVGTDTSAFALPWSVEHTIEDMVLCTSTDISGLIKIARPLAHDFTIGTSYVSSILPFGDLFSRAYGDFAQQAMLYPWSDERQGSEILPNYNGEIYPIVVNNTGAIRERWALIFTSTTAYRCVGEQSGQIGTGVTTADYAPINPATGLPYFTIRSAGFGAGWSTGNVLRFNTDAAGSPFWILRTVLQGDAQAATDKFRISFRGDVNRV